MVTFMRKAKKVYFIYVELREGHRETQNLQLNLELGKTQLYL